MDELTGKVVKIINKIATSETTSSDKLYELDAYVRQRRDKPEDNNVEEEYKDPSKTKFFIKKSTRKKIQQCMRKVAKRRQISKNMETKSKEKQPGRPGTNMGEFKGISGETKVLKLDAQKPKIRILKSKQVSEAGKYACNYSEQPRRN